MTSLHHDRLLAEGAAPADQATTAHTRPRSTSTSSAGRSEEKAESTVPPQRQGETQPDGARRTTDSTTRSRTPRATKAPTGVRATGSRTSGTGAAGTLAAKAKAARAAT